MPEKLGPTLPGKVSKVKVKRSETAAQLAKLTPAPADDNSPMRQPLTAAQERTLHDVMQRHIVLSAMGVADDDDEVELTTQADYGLWPVCGDCKKQVDPVNYSLHVKGHGS